MLNMHETVLNEVPGNEQPQEDVQLTELVPVKQSRIRETSIFRDADATDALKVLRSFTAGCNDEGEYDIQTFNFSEKINSAEKEDNKLKGTKNQRKRINKCGNRDIDEETNERNTKNKSENLTIKKQARGIGKMAADGIKTIRKKVITALTNNKNKQANNEISENVNTNYFSEDDEENFVSQDDEEEEIYYDKTKELKDEVYVFRQERVHSRTSTDPSKDRDSGNPDSNDSQLNKSNLSRQQQDLNDISNDKEHEEDALRNEDSPDLTHDSTKKELSLNINAIIQANYLFEQENNNVISPSRTKHQESSSSSPTSVSTLTEGFSSSSGEENSCSKKTSDVSEQEGQQKKYCCVVCDARFKGSGGLRNHYKIVHGAGPIFKCDECGKEFPLKERLKLHVRTHTGFKPYKCPECDKSFARGGQLVQHRRTHSQIKPYRCNLCSGTFTCAANLALHVKRHNGQKDHKCEICGRAFVRRDALKKHLECLHRDVKSFLCVICNKTFKGHLPQHMRTHARDRPHGCATCGQRFAQKSQLTVHQRTHSGQRPFRCLVCWQAFAHSTALKLHTRRHTGERPFKCAECNAGFTQLPHWKKHMKCIHGRNEPYGCKRCKSFFRIKNDLESHEKTCHPDAERNSDGVSVTDPLSNETTEKTSPPAKYRVMTVERMRLLLAVLLKRISRQERLDELGFGKRLIDEVLQDSLLSAGKDPAMGEGLSELEALTKNLEIFLEWTVPREHWENFRKLKKTPEDILETLTAT